MLNRPATAKMLRPRPHQQTEMREDGRTGPACPSPQLTSLQFFQRIGEGTEPIYEEHGENAIRIP